MSAYRSSLFRSLKKEVSEKLPQGWLRPGVPGEYLPVVPPVLNRNSRMLNKTSRGGAPCVLPRPRWMTAILVLRVVRRVRIRSGEVRVGHRALNALPPWSLTFVSGYV